MSASRATEVAHAAAVIALLDDALGVWSAYDYDDVPLTLPNLYAVLTVTRRFGDDFRFSYGRLLTGYRLTTTAVGRTVDEARWVRDRIAATLSDQPLTIGGATSTPARFEVETAIGFDDNRYSGTTTWTYAL